jgi:hypothetical protein
MSLLGPCRWGKDARQFMQLGLGRNIQISPTSGGCSVGIFRLRTKGHGVCFVLPYTSRTKQQPVSKELFGKHCVDNNPANNRTARQSLQQSRFRQWKDSGVVQSAWSEGHNSGEGYFLAICAGKFVGQDFSLWKGGLLDWKSAMNCCGWGTGTAWEPKGKVTSAVGSRYQSTAKHTAEWEDQVLFVANCGSVK